MFKTRFRRALTASVIAVVCVVPATAAAKPTITLSGSTSVAPLAAQLASKYVRYCDSCVGFKLLQGGSDIGIADVARGRVTIGMSSRDPKAGDPGGLVFNQIAKDAICIVTSPDNPIPNLSQDQIKAIFGGTVRSWNQVPGSSRTGTINVNVRTPASGTQDAFQKIFLGTTKVFSGASQRASNGIVQQSVKTDPDAIGYVSLSFAEGLNAAGYQGVACTLPNAKSGQYAGVRNFYMVTLGAAKGAAAKWIKWIKGNDAAETIISKEWAPLS